MLECDRVKTVTAARGRERDVGRGAETEGECARGTSSSPGACACDCGVSSGPFGAVRGPVGKLEWL